MIPAVIYAAKSSKDEGGSLESQIERCRERIEREGEREVVGCFRDEDASGWSGNRGPNLEAAMKLAQDLAGDHPQVEAWVFHSSRLGRGSGLRNQARSLMEVLVATRRDGVTVRSVEDDAFTTNSMLWGVVDGLAHGYARDLSAHTRRGKRSKIANGHWGGGRIPDGYAPTREIVRSKPRTRLEADPERTALVQRVFKLGLTGANGNEVARLLTAEGHVAVAWFNRDDEERTPFKRTGLWTPRRVRQMWRVPVYAGLQWMRTDDGKELVPCDVPVLVDPDDWHRLQGILDARRREYEPRAGRGERGRFGAGDGHRVKRGQRPSRHHLLGGGLLRCARCGGAVHSISNWRSETSPHTTTRRYRCGRARDGLCTAPLIDAELLEAPILESFQGLTLDLSSWLDLRRSEQAADREQLISLVERAAGEVADVDARIAAVRSDYARMSAEGNDAAIKLTLDTLADLDAERERASLRLDEQRATVDALPPEPTSEDADAFTGSLREALAQRAAGGTVIEANKALRGAIDFIECDPQEDGSVRLTAFLRDSFIAAFAADPESLAVASFVARPLLDGPRW